jgi:hypothetical protein
MATGSVPSVNRRAWWVAAAAVLGTVVLAWATTAGTAPMWDEADPVARQGPSAGRREETVESIAPVRFTRSADATEWDLTWLARALTAIVVVGVVALIAWRLARVRWRRTPRRVVEHAPAVALPAVAETVGDAEVELQETLVSGSPRNAIVLCWIRLEQAVAAAGLAPRSTETSLELTTRVLAAVTVDDASIQRLGALYREARFSRHELGEAHRRAAIEALSELLEQLATARSVDREPVP